MDVDLGLAGRGRARREGGGDRGQLRTRKARKRTRVVVVIFYRRYFGHTGHILGRVVLSFRLSLSFFLSVLRLFMCALLFVGVHPHTRFFSTHLFPYIFIYMYVPVVIRPPHSPFWVLLPVYAYIVLITYCPIIMFVIERPWDETCSCRYLCSRT